MPGLTDSISNVRRFSFLNQTINILLVDDTPEVLEYMASVFSQVEIYNVHTARNAKSAAKILQSETRIHQVTLDLGISDFNNDEFGLLKKFGSTTPFVVITGQNDTEKGGQCIINGAKGVLHKPLELNELLPRINSFTLQSILAPRKYTDPGSIFARSLTDLFEHNPRNISEWAHNLQVTTAGLWRAWDEVHATAVKQVLLVYQLYSAAFRFYENQIFGTGNSDLPISNNEYDRLCKRFLICRNELENLFK